MSMISGRKRPCLVLIQNYTKTDGQWGEAKAWAEFCRAWVSIDPERGREQFTSNEREAISTHIVRGDYLEMKDVTPRMRIVFSPEMSYGNGSTTVPSTCKVYDILAVMPDENARGDVMLRVQEEERRYGELG